MMLLSDSVGWIIQFKALFSNCSYYFAYNIPSVEQQLVYPIN